jgi:hypothetical protein
VNQAQGATTKEVQMAPSNKYKKWLTAQQTSIDLDTTSAEVCRLLSIGRLSGVKFKQPGRAGKAQWLVNPGSVAKERKRAALAAKKARAKNSTLGKK